MLKIVLRFPSFSQRHCLTGDVQGMQVREISELVVSSDVSIVCCKGHQEVDQGEDHQGARHRRQDEHHLSPLNIVDAELLYFKLAFYQQVLLLCICREKEVKRVEVNHPITVPVPLNLVCAADAPAECVESGHDNTAGKY